jgi:UDP-2,3-diacylglucosamine hydrolase
VEAGRALVLDKSEMLALADDAGVFVCGIDAGLPGQGVR